MATYRGFCVSYLDPFSFRLQLQTNLLFLCFCFCLFIVAFWGFFFFWRGRGGGRGREGGSRACERKWRWAFLCTNCLLLINMYEFGEIFTEECVLCRYTVSCNKIIHFRCSRYNFLSFCNNQSMWYISLCIYKMCANICNPLNCLLSTDSVTVTVHKSYYPPGNHHASH